MGRSRSRGRRRDRRRSRSRSGSLGKLLPLLQALQPGMVPMAAGMPAMAMPAPAMPPMPSMATPALPACAPAVPGALPGMPAQMDMAALQKQIQDNLTAFYTNMQNQMTGSGGGGGGHDDDGREGGYVINWNMEKGFGFIKPDKGGDDIFAHVTALKDGDCLREGDQIRFSIKFDEKVGKHRAEDVIGAWWERDLEKERRKRRDSYSRSRGRGKRRRDDSRERDRYKSSDYGRGSNGQEVCRQFQRRGNCDFGDKCKFWHDGGAKKKSKSRRRSRTRRRSRSKSRKKTVSRSKSRDKEGKYIFRSDEH